MNTKVIYIGLLDIFISMIFTVFIIWVSYKIIQRLVFRKAAEEETSNLSSGILVSSIILSMGLLIQQSAEPLINIYRLLSTQELSYQALFIQFLKTMLIYLGITLALGIVIVLVGVLLFTGLTRDVNEWKAIRENNIAVALITGVIIIVITLAIKDGLGLIFESWIPYPETPRFY
jgi:uncharacterized membrane protein YjfL (UPF0719 family)